MPLFEIGQPSGTATPINPTTFPALKLWERQDLEAWVTSAPNLAGGDFTVVTSEFDRFDRTSERLDVLGVVKIDEGHGRLVVIELKRDGSSTTVDLQAIKYAAYVASSQFSDIAEMYARHHKVDEDEAKQILIDLLGGDEDAPPTIDSTPRIVLVAGDFRPEVTTTVLWLIDNFEVDIRCVRLQPYEIAGRVIVSTETIIPLPEAEQYRLGVQRKRREVARDQEAARAGRLLPRLIDAGILEIGQSLLFRRDSVPDDAEPPWSRDEPAYSATVETAEGIRTLRWSEPHTGIVRVESPSLLAARILHELGAREGEISSAGINGMHYWTVDGEKSLHELAVENGMRNTSVRRIDRGAVRALLKAIPPGHWTTYGDVARAIGSPGAAQSAASAIASDPLVENAHRVLRANGAISPEWAGTDGSGPMEARSKLEAEGVEFGDGDYADPKDHWQPPLPAS